MYYDSENVMICQTQHNFILNFKTKKNNTHRKKI